MSTQCSYNIQEQQARGVIAASAGNHALALAYHGQMLDIPVTVVMPIIAPLMKISLCRSYGATIIIEGAGLTESREYALRMAQAESITYINGYTCCMLFHPYIL
jgi:threonine dehydratase